jgi:hypothetical protein
MNSSAPSTPVVKPRRRLGDRWVRFIPWVLVVAFILAMCAARDRGWDALKSTAILAAIIAEALIGGWILGVLYERRNR